MAIYSSRLRLALPQGRDLDVICDHLRTCGFDLPDLDSPGLYPVEDPRGSGVGFDIFKLAQSDVGTYVEHGISQLGVMSTDLLNESGARVWRPFTFSYGTYPIVLAAPRGINFDSLSTKPTIRLATSLPHLTRDVFAARGMAIEIVPVEDSTTACLLGLADGYVDRLVDPEAIVREGFRVIEVLGKARLKLLINHASYTARREAIDSFIECLRDHQPEPPEPIHIPFDLDE
jgi:ATP phosphoribosyltransferase